MQKFKLSIPVLRETISGLQDVIQELEEMKGNIVEVNTDLCGSGWTGSASEQFSYNSENWSSIFEDYISNMNITKDSLSQVVLTKAQDLDIKANNLAGIMGGAGGKGGGKELVSFSQEHKENVSSRCDDLYWLYEGYVTQLKTINEYDSNLCYTSFSICGNLQSSINQIRKKQEMLDGLKGAMDEYQSGITELEAQFKSAISAIKLLEGASAAAGLLLKNMVNRFGVKVLQNFEQSNSVDISEEYEIEIEDTDDFGALGFLKLALNTQDKSEDIYGIIETLKEGIFFSARKKNGKYYITIRGSSINGKNRKTWAQLQDYLTETIKAVDWDKYDVKTLTRDGIKVGSSKGNKYFTNIKDGIGNGEINKLDDFYKTLSKGNRLSGMKKAFQETFINEINPLKAFKKWESFSKIEKAREVAGKVGDILIVAENFSEQFIENGEVKVSADRIQDFATNTAVDFIAGASTTAAGAAIGSCFAPPVGTVVGFAAGAAIDTLCNWDIVDWDGDGQKDSAIDGVKMLVDNACDAAGKWLSDTFW